MCHSGHIKSIHIWPARRPLAACRAALLTSLIDDPGTPDARRVLCEQIGGRVVEVPEVKRMPNGTTVERTKRTTLGGVLAWKSELENLAELKEIIDKIPRIGSQPIRLIDPFSGGGAIPLEGMRLGLESTAVDVNPVAWFILKCTLDYPNQLASKSAIIPKHAADDNEFLDDFYGAHPHLVGRTKKSKKQIDDPQQHLFDKGDSGRLPRADLAWSVRAWGRRLYSIARQELAYLFPVYAEFCPANPKSSTQYECRDINEVPLKPNGSADIDSLNADFTDDYLAKRDNPRWIARRSLAYLWCRTVVCKHCRTTVPLLKSCWLSKKASNRAIVSLNPDPDSNTVSIDVICGVSSKGGNSAQKRESDKKIGRGTMSRSGVTCPCCGTITSMDDLRVLGKSGQIGEMLYAVVTDANKGKAFRKPTSRELEGAQQASELVDTVFRDIPFGVPHDPMPSESALGMRVQKYGYTTWDRMFCQRQLAVLGVLVRAVRKIHPAAKEHYGSSAWADAIVAYLACAVDKIADYNSSFVAWQPAGCKGSNTFQRWALPMKWDFTEVNPLESDSGGILGVIKWVTEPLTGTLKAATKHSPRPRVLRQSSISKLEGQYDIIVTDPPYYDAIPYSDCMDFFYVWLRRILHGLNSEWTNAFSAPLSPKWNTETEDGELIDDLDRHERDKKKSKSAYENGMAKVFQNCHDVLKDEGLLVIVFAHKNPNAWETLVSAIIRAGFVVNASWPIQTEMANRIRSMSSAALASSVWLVCRKRFLPARPGWDSRVLQEMKSNMGARLRLYWDAGIRGPDFVWAATGPALEAFSKYPIVKRANSPREIMDVGDFLSQVRKLVVEFVVGQVLSGTDSSEASNDADRMDSPTAYYLLHRNDFGHDEAPSGACILYSTACGLSDRELESVWDLVSQKGAANLDDDAGDDEVSASSSSSTTFRLKEWSKRTRPNMGFEAPAGVRLPLIDRVHRLMHLWKGGDVHNVDKYLDDNGLRRQELFKRLVQSVIELADPGSEERKLLESLSNHVQAKGATSENGQKRLTLDSEEATVARASLEL